MERQQHLFFSAEETKLSIPFADLIRGIESMLELATPSTRQLFNASWRRYRQLSPTLISPTEEHEAWVERDGQDAVNALYKKCLKMHGAPDLGVMVGWVPNFQWRGLDSFSVIGIESQAEGHKQCHYLRVASNTGFEPGVTILAQLAFPVSEPGDDFVELRGQLEQRLGFRMKDRYWRVRTPPTGRKRGWKISRL